MPLNLSTHILRAASLALLVARIPAAADDKAALTDRLHNAETDTSLDDAGLQPWHLKLDVQLFDSKGKPTEQGNIEEWWAAPNRRLVAFSLPDYTGKLLGNEEGTFRTADSGSEPALVSLLLNQVVHPMPPTRDVDESVPDLRKQTFGKVPLECIMLSQPIKMVAFLPLGLYPTYCFDPGKDSLRASYDFGSQTVIRNRVGLFQKHSVAIDITVLSGEIKVASAHVVSLTGLAADPAMFARTDEFASKDKTARIAGGVMAGQIVSKAQPVYPASARQKHITGAVILQAIIGRDGHVYSLRPISFPDPDLAIAAIAAVRQWTYKPYLLNGDPTEVNTTITVNFNISP